MKKIDYHSLVQELSLRNVNDNGNVEIWELENACHYIKGFHDPYSTSITVQGTPIFLSQIHLTGENRNFMTLLRGLPEHVCFMYTVKSCFHRKPCTFGFHSLPPSPLLPTSAWHLLLYGAVHGEVMHHIDMYLIAFSSHLLPSPRQAHFSLTKREMWKLNGLIHVNT